jgi:hypothetical protein
MNGPRGPSAEQKIVHKHWINTLKETAQARQDVDRLVVVNMGDAVEGLHHASKEIVSDYLTDHQKIHIALMKECKEITQYDTLFYVNGTPVHAGEDEYDIATVLGAELYKPGNFTHPILKRKIYNHLVFAAHHGPGAGAGAAKGNALRGKLKNLYFESMENRQPMPKLIVTAHVHQHAHEMIDRGGHEYHWYTLPSWKLPDDFLNRINPFAFNNIGAMLSTCTPDGIASEYKTVHVEQIKTVTL